jgi:hypothetical protein
MFYHFLYLQSLYLSILIVVAALENSVPTSLVTRDCNMSFLEDEQDMSIKMSEVNDVHGSGRTRRSGRLHSTKDCQKKQPASGDPLKNPEKEQSSTLKVVENHDLDTAVPDNVSTNLPEILSDGKYLDMFVNDSYVCLFMIYLLNILSFPIPTVSIS